MTHYLRRISSLPWNRIVWNTYSKPISLSGQQTKNIACLYSNQYLRPVSNINNSSYTIVQPSKLVLHTRAFQWQQAEERTATKSQEEVITPYQPVAEKLDKRDKNYPWKWRSFLPEHTYKPNLQIDLTRHHEPLDFRDKIALGIVKFLRVFADAFFRKRYGHRAVVLETVAAVPGMVGGMLQHLQSLRRFKPSGGWIRVLLDEAENERMHLMTFMAIAKPTLLERSLVLLTQGGFFAFYALIYIISPKTAHRIVGYLEEEAIISYTQYLQEIDKGTHANIPAPEIAIDYWQLDRNARLRDVVLAVRADEAHHRDVNHLKANLLYKKKYEEPAPVEALRHGDVNPEEAFRDKST
jgi:ubiquinol oxidase